jgi:lipid-A-disaccharide synthase
MLVILPFEEAFYQKWNYKVTYVGHPLIEVVTEEKRKPTSRPLSDKPIIALLPGSRSQEIRAKLPVMLQMIPHFPQYEFIIAQASAQPDSLYTAIMGTLKVKMVKADTYNLLRQSAAALVTSGTATLETALFGVPEVVCYKGNSISFWLAKKLVRIKYISLVNLIMDKPVIKELIQEDLNELALKEALDSLLYDEAYKKELQKDYAELWHKLGNTHASDKAASEIISLISSPGERS